MEDKNVKRSAKIMSIKLCLFLMAAIAIPVAAQQCKPLVGSFEAQVQPADTCPGPLCTAGNVWGGIQGKYHFTMDKILPNGEPEVATISFFTGHSIIALKSGDELLELTRGHSTCRLAAVDLLR